MRPPGLTSPGVLGLLDQFDDLAFGVFAITTSARVAVSRAAIDLAVVARHNREYLVKILWYRTRLVKSRVGVDHYHIVWQRSAGSKVSADNVLALCPETERDIGVFRGDSDKVYHMAQVQQFTVRVKPRYVIALDSR